MSDRGHALTPIPEAPDAALPFRCAASKPPDHWHDSGEMALEVAAKARGGPRGSASGTGNHPAL